MRRQTPDYVIDLAQELRKRQTAAEAALWDRLRNRKLHGLKFYRQCPIGRYIPDFLCNELRLVIELDGGVHDEARQRDYDVIRSREIGARHITVLRFTNEQVMSDIESVMMEIESYCDPAKNPYIGPKPKPVVQDFEGLPPPPS